MHPSLYEVFLHACLDADAADDLRRDPKAFLERHGVPQEDVAAMMQSPPRLGVYRMMVRNTLSDVVFARMPRTRARMNSLAKGAFDETFVQFLAERGPKTHYLRDVPGEFLDWALPRWRAHAAIPTYLPELARYELVEFTIATMPDEKAAPPGDLVHDRPLLFSSTVRLAHYAHALHELPVDIDDRSVPNARDVTILAYRDATHAVRFLELTPYVATVMAALLAGRPLGSAIPAAAAAHHLEMSDQLLIDMAYLLADFGERTIFLGARQAD